jgi:hypothetical protein
MKYPGKILKKPPANDPQLSWFNDAQKLEHGCDNPCVRLYGFGPENEICKNCRLLFWHCCSRKYFKCELRGCTHGPATDHRANWPACGRFIKRYE